MPNQAEVVVTLSSGVSFHAPVTDDEATDLIEFVFDIKSEEYDSDYDEEIEENA